MSNLFQSRKFLILLLDAIFGIAALAVAFYLAENIETQAFIVAIFALIQPVFYGIIDSIAKEDIAALGVRAHPNQQV